MSLWTSVDKPCSSQYDDRCRHAYFNIFVLLLATAAHGGNIYNVYITLQNIFYL